MAIVDADVAARAGWSVTDLAAAYLAGGATWLQIRDKGGAAGRLLENASTIVTLARAARARVIVNDRADIARMSNADGVHVGQEDLAPALVRRIVGTDAVVGVSTHTREQLETAIAGVNDPATAVSYVAIGPIYRTSTKTTGYDPIGLAGVRAAAAFLAPYDIPLVAIGGITFETAADVIRAGAASVAVIGDLLSTADPIARVRGYLERLTL